MGLAEDIPGWIATKRLDGNIYFTFASRRKISEEIRRKSLLSFVGLFFILSYGASVPAKELGSRPCRTHK